MRVSAYWGYVGPAKFDQQAMVLDGIDPSKYMIKKEGYRLRVTIRDEESGDDVASGE